MNNTSILLNKGLKQESLESLNNYDSLNNNEKQGKNTTPKSESLESLNNHTRQKGNRKSESLYYYNRLQTLPQLKDLDLDIIELEVKRENLLQTFMVKQPFRVAIGKANKLSKWINYEEFNPAYNLREILDDEIVIEFDSKKKWEEMTEKERNDFENTAWEGINFTGINLLNAGYTFEVWSHEGKSPHLHIHNIPIKNLEPDKRSLFKKMFIRKYTPKEYLALVDISLTGIHLIALEWANHWKGCYDVKKLTWEFKP